MKPQKTEDPKQNQFLTIVRTLVDARLADPRLGVTRLSQDVHLSRAQLHRRLKALTGLSVTAYIRMRRLTKAKELLERTELGVSQIAFEVGFRDPAYFSRVFTRLERIAPTRYRRENRKRSGPE